MTYAHTAQFERKPFFSGLFASYSEQKIDVFRRQMVAKTVRKLENLSDRQLNDIGVPRSEIHRRAYDSVYHGSPFQQ